MKTQKTNQSSPKEKSVLKRKWYMLPAKILLVLVVAFLIANVNILNKAEAAESADPIGIFKYSLEANGTSLGYFSECSGLGSENEVIVHKIIQGGQTVIRFIPGKLSWNNIVLKRPMTADKSLWDWREQVEAGNIAAARRNLAIIVYNQADQEIARFSVRDSWISKITTYTDGTEEVTIVSEGIQRAN